MDKCKYLFLLSIMYLLSACVSYDTLETDRSRISVVSFEEYWPKLEEKALAWYPDAYLLEAILPISVDSINSKGLFASAYFLSNSDPDNMLEVEMDANGELHSKVIAITPLKNAMPIKRKDWTIDSGDALEKLLTDDDLKFLTLQSEKHCSELNLRRKPQLVNKPVVWRILVVDCRISEYNHDESIDAISGEIRKRIAF